MGPLPVAEVSSFSNYDFSTTVNHVYKVTPSTVLEIQIVVRISQPVIYFYYFFYFPGEINAPKKSRNFFVQK